MRILLTVLLLMACSLAFSQVTIPETASPRYAFEAISFNSSFLDTFFVDDQAPDTFSGVVWNPIYQASYIQSSGTPASGYPKLVGHQRVVGNKTYFRQDDFFIQRTGLQFDFDVDVGDSIWVLAPDSHPLGLDSVLHLIDSVVVTDCSFTAPTKLIYSCALYDYPNREGFMYRDVWVEKVGSMFHSFFPVACIEEAGVCELFYAKQYAYVNGDWIDVRNIFCDGIPAVIPTNCQFSPTSTEAGGSIDFRVSLYPNPVQRNASITVEFEQWTITEITIFDSQGNRVAMLNGGDEVFYTIDTTDLRPGVYLIHILSQNGKVGLSRLVVTA